MNIQKREFNVICTTYICIVQCILYHLITSEINLAIPLTIFGVLKTPILPQFYCFYAIFVDLDVFHIIRRKGHFLKFRLDINLQTLTYLFLIIYICRIIQLEENIHLTQLHNWRNCLCLCTLTSKLLFIQYSQVH